MNTNQLYRRSAPHPARTLALGIGSAVVATGLLCAGAAFAQTSAAQGSSAQQPAPAPEQPGRAASPGQRTGATAPGAYQGAGGTRQLPGSTSVGQPSRAASTGQQAGSELSPATIRMIQHSLMQGGYAVSAADGVWGPRTVAALREFQRVKGMQPTGRPDAQTLAALGVATSAANGAATQPAMQRQAGARQPPVQARTPADLDRATIRAIQQALSQHGLQVGAADGVWGERTTSAIGNFQRARGLPASGEPDAHTLAALGLLPGGSSRVDLGRSGQLPGPATLDPAAIRMIQQALDQRGFQIGTVDGVWGERTTNALREFQRAQGLEPLGDPDVHTLAALGLLPGSDSMATAGRLPR